MAPHPRHAAPKTPKFRRVGLTVSAASAMLLGAAGAASADVVSEDAVSAADPVGSLGHALGPAKDLKLYPLAQTGVDPLDNAVGTQIADFQPVSTTVATDPVTQGGSLHDLPVVNEAAHLLPG